MAIPAFGGAADYDFSATTGNLDLSQELSAILLADTMFLGRIGSGGTCTQVQHYWLEESLNAHYVQLNGAVAAGDANITIDAVSSGVYVGALLINETESGVDEVLQVTAVTSTTVLAVGRAVGDSAPVAQAHADNSRLRIVNAKQEGDESVNDQSTARSRKSNTCQIFKKEAKISGTHQAVDMVGVPNEMQHQLAQRMLEIKRELAISVWSGVQIAGGSDTVIRSMNGVRNFVRSQSTQTDTTSQAFGEPLVNALYKKIYDKGGEASIAIGSADQMKKFSQLNADKVRLAPSDRARGVFVTKYLTEYGAELDMMLDRWCLPGDLMIADPRKVRLLALNGRQFKATPLKESGDALISMIVGEYTLEVRNAAECFALATALTL